MYTAFHSISAYKQIDYTTLFPSRDQRPIWQEGTKEVLDTIVGNVSCKSAELCADPKSKEMLLLLVRASSLVVEYETVQKALERNPADDELVCGHVLHRLFLVGPSKGAQR